MAAAIGASLDEHEAHGKGSGLPPADVIFGAQGEAGSTVKTTKNYPVPDTSTLKL